MLDAYGLNESYVLVVYVALFEACKDCLHSSYIGVREIQINS